jgi:ABC-type multidrug transport system ATPase subunit
LNLLAGRAIGKSSGKLLFNGCKREDSADLASQQVYIMQDDLLMKTQTPFEIISFSANLRLSDSFSKQEKENRVRDIISELNISNCQNTMVGKSGETRGISGGERKRTAIGMELVTNPSLLFIDEPTTGKINNLEFYIDKF